MPFCRRKRVVLTEPSKDLLASLKSNPKREVFFLKQTGEIFENYEAYAARMSFYRLKQFQCEVTGKSGLDYFQAIESERLEARTLHSRFSPILKPVVLRAVQWQVMGRLDHLVEAVYDRYKDRYFKGEKIIVDLSGRKFHASVETVYPPKYFENIEARDMQKETRGAMTESDNPHHHLSDLKISAKEYNAIDPPEKYYYWVTILEPERDKAHDKSRSSQEKTQEVDAVGSLMEVTCHLMSRDRLSFSKSILRRFIRDCVDRDAALASPWLVKPAIAKRYSVSSEMPENQRIVVEEAKRGESDKRKKAWEDKDGPPNKKFKKSDEKVSKKEREMLEKAEKQRLAKEEAERIAAAKKKKPTRYPAEDLDLTMTDKDKKAGMKIQKPIPSRTALPFNDFPGVFESFLMTWNFLVVYGQPLHLSPFTLDEFEGAMRHSVEDPPCSLLAEIHSTLIYNLRTVPFHRHSLVMSIFQLQQNDGGESPAVLGNSIPTLNEAMADIGNNWERIPLRPSEDRAGWEEALIGCLKDHATLQSFPQVREIMTKLLFAPTENAEGDAQVEELPPVPLTWTTPSTVTERYIHLPPSDRIAIIAFMTNLAISSKAVHAHMESCEEQLTALRKEKIEVNRAKKALTEEMSHLPSEPKAEASASVSAAGTPALEDDAPMADASGSEMGGSEAGSEVASVSTKKKGGKNLQKVIQSQAKQRKQAPAKEAKSEQKRVEDELSKAERRLEGIERDFRRLLGNVRVKIMGKDRFYNRVWWFDGLGSASAMGTAGSWQYGTGRLFIQGPSEVDMDMLRVRQEEEDLDARRKEEEGEDGILGPDEWAVYTEVEEVEEYMNWLSIKGIRENPLKSALTKWWPHISAGLKKRQGEMQAQMQAKLVPEARRSSRVKKEHGNDITKEPYMLWTNKKAATT